MLQRLLPSPGVSGLEVGFFDEFIGKRLSWTQNCLSVDVRRPLYKAFWLALFIYGLNSARRRNSRQRYVTSNLPLFGYLNGFVPSNYFNSCKSRLKNVKSHVSKIPELALCALLRPFIFQTLFHHEREACLALSYLVCIQLVRLVRISAQLFALFLFSFFTNNVKNISRFS